MTRLGALSGVGARNLSARFKPAVGWTPRDFIMACRLETAWSLVVGTDLKIEEIAAVLGYRSSQVFTDAFQRWYRMRPTTYREQFSQMLQG